MFLLADGYHHHLGVNTWTAGSAPSGDDDARLLSWDLLLPGEEAVTAMADGLRAAGVQVIASGTSLQASDPWGVTVRIAADRAGAQQAEPH